MDFLQEYSHSTPHSVWEKVRNQFQHKKYSCIEDKGVLSPCGCKNFNAVDLREPGLEFASAVVQRRV